MCSSKFISDIILLFAYYNDYIEMCAMSRVTSHKHFPLADIPPSEAEWVKQDLWGPFHLLSLAAVVMNIRRESTLGFAAWGIRAALQCWWYSVRHVSPHQRIHLCFGSFKPISTLHPLSAKREPCSHTSSKCQGAVLVFTGLNILIPSRSHMPKL